MIDPFYFPLLFSDCLELLLTCLYIIECRISLEGTLAFLSWWREVLNKRVVLLMLARFLVDDFCWWYTLTKLRFFKGEPGFCVGDKIEFCISSREVFAWLEMIYVWFKFLYLLDAVPIVLVLRWAWFEFLVLWFNATWEMALLLAMWLLFPSYLLLVTLLKFNCIVLFSEFLLEL